MASMLRQLVSCVVVAWIGSPFAISGFALPADAPTPGRIYATMTLQLKDAADGNQVHGIIAIDPATGKWTRLTEGASPRVSPDGQTMLFTRIQASQPPHDLWNSDTGRADNPGLIAKGMGGGTFVWIPDSRYIIVSAGKSIEGKPSDVSTLRIGADGTRQALPIPATDYVSDLSADGQWLLVTSSRHRAEGLGWQLYRMRLDGSKKGLNLQVLDLENLTDVCIASETDRATNAVQEVSWSPDGKRLCVVRFDFVIEDGKRVLREPADSHYRLELMAPDGSDVRPLELENATVIWCGRPDWR